MIIRFSLLFFALFQLGCSHSQNINRPVPFGVFPYEYVKNDSLIDFHIAVNMFHRAPAGSPTEYDYHRGIILDPDGYIAWYQDKNPSNAFALNNFHYQTELKQFQETILGAGGGTPFRTLDTTFQFIDAIGAQNVQPDSHEFIKTSNGDQFIITRNDSIFDLSSYTIYGVPGNANTTVRCKGIQGFDVNGNLIFEWNSCNHVHPSESYGFNYNQNDFNYFHMNSVDVDENGDLIVSGRHSNLILKIDRATSQVVWQLGGINSDFTFVSDSGFSGQHDARSIGNGQYTLFDNGNLILPQKSRAITYQLDTNNWTATLVSAYDPAPSVFGSSMGNYRQIGNYGVVGYGSVFRPDPNIAVHDQNMDLAAAYYFTDSVQSYRAVPFHLDFILPRPSVFCFDSLGQTYIKAEGSYSSFEWSTGETTEAILPILGETYQVYVPYGVGRLGSIPLTYDGNCHLSVSELDLSKPSVVKTIDLLGREVTGKKIGGLYINVYTDGSSQLHYFTGE